MKKQPKDNLKERNEELRDLLEDLLTQIHQKGVAFFQPSAD